MARRSSTKQQAALKSVDYISSQYAVRNEMRRKEILQSAFEKREKSIDDMFAFATQALGVIDKMSAKKKQDAKIEKSVTSMASKQGGEVSYKKSNIGDWLKGDSKFSELGKESWSIGGQQFDRADMLAYDKFEMKNKWEGHIGEDMKTDKVVDAVKGEVVEKKNPGIKKEELSKAYSISGSTKDIEEEYGAGWSYGKQKAIRKTAKQVERGEKRLERYQEKQQRSKDMQQWKEEHGGTVKKGALAAGAVGVAVTNPAIAAGAAGLYGAKKGGEYLYEKGTEYLEDRKKKAHDLKLHNKALANQAWRVGRGKAYEQVIAMSGKPGKDFDKIMGAYEQEYGSTEQTKDLKRDRADFIKENPYMKEGTDEEPQPSKFEDMIKNIKEYGGKLNIFKNLTKETSAKSEVGEALNADTSYPESDTAYAPKDVGEDGPDWDTIEKDRLVERLPLSAMKAEKKIKAEAPKPDTKPKPKGLAASGIKRTQGYIDREYAFDNTISSEGLTLAPSYIDKEGGQAQFNLYGEAGNVMVENAMTVKLDDKGQATREMTNINPSLKKWNELGNLYNPSGMTQDYMEKLQKQMLALAG